MNKLSLYFKLAKDNILKNRRIYVPYMLSAIGTIMMYYIILALPEGINKEEMFGGATVEAFLSIGSNVIMVFAAIFLFYTNSFIIKRRKKELGLYNILGMEKGNIAGIIFVETLAIAITSILVGLLLGVIFNKLMFMLLAKLIGVTVQVSFTISIAALSQSLILFAVIFLVTLIYNLFQIILAKPIDLLHGGEFGEKEPKANWLVAILGVLLLGAGYYISLTIVSPVDAIMLFFGAVILVVIGTYLIFISGMTVFLKVLRKNKKFYYKPNHFTTVSGMIYRMKQNAAGLATICILSTSVLVMISVTFSMYSSIENIISSRYPNDIALTVYQIDEDDAGKIGNAVREEIEKQNVEAENVHEFLYTDGAAKRVRNEFIRSESYPTNASYFEIMSQEEYSRKTGNSLNLKANEVAIQNVNTTEKYDTVILGGHEYTTKYVDDFTFTGEESTNLVDTYFIFTADTKTAAEIADYFSFGDKNATAPFQYHIAFDMGNDENSQKDMMVAMRERLADLYERGEINDDIHRLDGKSIASKDFMEMYGSFFFLGIFLGLMFIMALVLIIYYKQVTEGYDDKGRFEIMQNVGMSHAEVKRSINSQILLVFFIPLVVALIHLAFAMPILLKIMSVMYLSDTLLIILSTIGVSIVFAVIYTAVYLITARTYFKIVEA